MRVFALMPDHLRILDTALHGRLADALADIAREGGDPVLGVERIKSWNGAPSSWYLLVLGGSRTHRFEITAPAALGVTAQIHLKDHVAELAAELTARAKRDEAADQLELEFQRPWSRPPGSGSPS